MIILKNIIEFWIYLKYDESFDIDGLIYFQN